MVSQTNQEDFLSPIQEDEFLPPVSRWTTLGGMLLASAVGIAISLASLIEYNITVEAKASVRPAGELRIVQAATEGTVINISVEGNQVVTKGDAIATIDDSRLQTKKSQLQINIGQAQLQLAQINAQIRALDRQIFAETDRINRAVTISEQELNRSIRGYRDKQITANAQVEEAEANLRSAEASSKAARSKRQRYQPIAKDGAISRNQLEEVGLEVEQQEQAVKAARARWQHAKATLNPVHTEVVIAKERIRQEKAIGEATLATLNREREALIQQRIQIQKQLERDARELQQVEIDLNQTVIRAPVDGTLFKLNLRNSGQTVRPGEEIAQIAPSNTPLVVKALVAAQDVSKVKTDQKAQVRVSACPYPDYGTLKGKVKAIAPDAIAPQANGATMASSQKAAAAATFYEVTISPESLFLGRGKNQCAIQLGMEGRAYIISKEETVLKFILRKTRLLTNL